MRGKSGSVVLRYTVAILLSAAAVLLRWLLDPWLGDRFALATLYAAVGLAVWLGGLWPATLTTFLGYTACDWLFIEPRGRFTVLDGRNLIGLTLYLLSCAVIIGFGEGMRQAGRRARESREEVLRILQGITDSFVAFDAGWRYTYINADAERQLRRSRAELLGNVVWDLFPQVLGTAIEAELRRAMREQVTREFRSFEPSVGRWFENRAYPLPGGGLAVHFRDVTDRHQAEEALRESRDVLSLAMRGGRMGHWSRNLATNQVWWSRELEEIFGLEPGGFEGNEAGFIAFLHEDDRAAVLQAVETALATHEDYAIEFRFWHASGEWRWMEGRGRAVYGADGHPVMLYGLGIDITERKRAEEALREANRRKDNFLAMLAHELRNPLAPIRNATEILRLKGPAEGDIRVARDVIDRQVRQMTRLVDDLLDVARITRGKIQLRKERVELAAVVGDAIEAARPLLEASAHKLTVKLPPRPVHLDADPTRLSQVLLNLLNNAAKYTPRGGHIRLTAEREESAVVIAVRDNGIGIAPEHLPHVFEMFSQITPALERSEGGLGIGLALVRGLLDLHGGSIEAHSEGPGRGSELIVRLPALAETAPAERQEPQSEPAEPQVPRYRILVVDDNRDAADSLALMLQLKGHDIRTAEDGAQGVRIAEEYLPDLVLLDIGMPKMNGYEAARHIRQQPWGKTMRLVALTGWGQDEDKRRAAEAGFDHHLTKPVEHERLEALLQEWGAGVGATQ